MGRREERDALQSTWIVLEPRIPGHPFRTKDIEDSAARHEAHQSLFRGALVVAQDPFPIEMPRRTYLPALARAADEPYELRDARRLRAHIESLNHVDEEAAQVPMPK